MKNQINNIKNIIENIKISDANIVSILNEGLGVVGEDSINLYKEIESFYKNIKEYLNNEYQIEFKKENHYINNVCKYDINLSNLKENIDKYLYFFNRNRSDNHSKLKNIIDSYNAAPSSKGLEAFQKEISLTEACFNKVLRLLDDSNNKCVCKKVSNVKSENVIGEILDNDVNNFIVCEFNRINFYLKSINNKLESSDLNNIENVFKYIINIFKNLEFLIDKNPHIQTKGLIIKNVLTYYENNKFKSYKRLYNKINKEIDSFID